MPAIRPVNVSIHYEGNALPEEREMSPNYYCPQCSRLVVNRSLDYCQFCGRRFNEPAQPATIRKIDVDAWKLDARYAEEGPGMDEGWKRESQKLGFFGVDPAREKYASRTITLIGGSANGRVLTIQAGSNEVCVPVMASPMAWQVGEADLYPEFAYEVYDARTGLLKETRGNSPQLRTKKVDGDEDTLEQGVFMDLYEYAVLYLPTDDAGDVIKASAKVITAPSTILAKSRAAAEKEAIRGLDAELDVDFVRVLVRPFVG